MFVSAMSTSKRRRTSQVTTASKSSTKPSTSRGQLIGQVSELLLLATESQLQALLRVLLEQVPTAGLEAVMTHADQNGLSSPAIRSSRWSRQASWSVLGQVFQCLEEQDLAISEGVCKRWRSASRNGLGWHDRQINEDNLHLRERLIKGRCSEARFEHHAQHAAVLPGFKHLQSLHVEFHEWIPLYPPFVESLTSLVLLCSWLGSHHIIELAPLRNLSTLTVGSDDFDAPRKPVH